MLAKTESEAKDTLDHQKLLEQRTSQENELLKLQSLVKDAEQQVDSLKKIARLASEATTEDEGDSGSSSYVSAEMARKATEESKAYEKEMKGASNQAKSYVKEILDNIQAER